jgi:hypothetical protein
LNAGLPTTVLDHKKTTFLNSSALINVLNSFKFIIMWTCVKMFLFVVNLVVTGICCDSVAGLRIRISDFNVTKYSLDFLQLFFSK